MSILIKKMFRRDAKKDQAKFKAETLVQLLGEYACNFSPELDNMWARIDIDGNGMLDETECEIFLH